MKSILVVDDEQSFVLALRLALEGAGFEVLPAYSGEEALLIMKERKPDYIVLDNMMPGMSGQETLDFIRSHPDFKSIPVIMMSGGVPLVSDKDSTWQAFVHKPFEIQELLIKLEKLHQKNKS